MNLRLYQEALVAVSAKKEMGRPVCGVPFMLAELADELAYVTDKAAWLGFNLEELASLSYERLNQRDPHRFPTVLG